jgi:hypothetical protein
MNKESAGINAVNKRTAPGVKKLRQRLYGRWQEAAVATGKEFV